MTPKPAKPARDPRRRPYAAESSCCVGSGCDGQVYQVMVWNGQVASGFQVKRQIPLCARHASQLARRRGIFRWQDESWIVAWSARMIERTRAMVDATK